MTALDSVSLHVDESAFVVILGPSGCGKTTLLNVPGALDRPTSGSVRVAGIDLTNASANERAAFHRAGVSFVFRSFDPVPLADSDRERALPR